MGEGAVAKRRYLLFPPYRNRGFLKLLQGHKSDNLKNPQVFTWLVPPPFLHKSDHLFTKSCIMTIRLPLYGAECAGSMRLMDRPLKCHIAH
jgi:hypothetical protein